ncbi:MAG TPA: response regulator transcription factor [Pyrinomonadaceae bacterium]|jgi:DNA-binding response OmpR family regulator|nr:response regulator transcription factor [Pyrinomonadaceae bacterium]
MSAVLIVEDEKHLADGLRFNLEAEGYTVETIGDGAAALALLLETPPKFDAVVLDVMLPGLDGFAVASELRRAGRFIPILMLTARGRPEDVLRGFESGADDYLPKPFDLTILIARLRGLLRRREWLRNDNSVVAPPEDAAGGNARRPPAREQATTQAGASVAPNEHYVFDGKTIDFAALELRVGARTVRLTLMEAELLRYLIQREGRVVSRKAMLEEVWNLREDTDTRAIDNFIVRLRKYIEEEPSKPKHLLTVRGVGYRFVAAPPAVEA